MELIPHPAFPPKAIHSVIVEIVASDGDEMLLCYRVRGHGELKLPEWLSPGRADDLWQTTCFELFVQPVGAKEYFEFNFSPSCKWAAYRFTGHREGRIDQPLHVEPLIERHPEPEADELGCLYGLDADVDLSEIRPGDLRIGLSAVIEEADGTKSYWSLAHPADKPDFHDPMGFVVAF